MKTLNLGILAHVDAGKTSLTERLLHTAGVIDEVGSVDGGDTQTDTMALERRRGITIKSAVVSFALGDLTVNLIDTPGHPDFIAEVERVLNVLDGAVLVISAVEGVQPQTRVLMRTLQRLRIPTVLFINKIDRVGAQHEPLLRSIAERLTPAIVSMGTPVELGTRAARFTPYGDPDADHAAAQISVLADHDERLMAAYVADERVSSPRLRRALVRQSRRAQVHPVFAGSAITGAGIDPLVGGIRELLPRSRGDAAGPVSGTVFKIERGPAGERVAYVRMFAGTARARDRVQVGHGGDAKITAIRVFHSGTTQERRAVAAGEIAKVWGLGEVRIGDPVGTADADGAHYFAPPTLETVVVPTHPSDMGRLHVALTQIAEQDPLINLRQDDARRELAVSLYGEVQKEVIQSTLVDDFDLEVEFRETSTICIERLIGPGSAAEFLEESPGTSTHQSVKPTIRDDPSPYLATVGLRVEPGPVGGGTHFRLAGEVHGTIPPSFATAVEETVHGTLEQGLYGWQVADCEVTMTHTGYIPRQGKRGQSFDSSISTSAGDFRKLTPLVLMEAVRQAGTAVYEPMHRFRLEIPADRLPPIIPVLARLRTVVQTQVSKGSTDVLEGTIPAARVHELQELLPALSQGEGVLESEFGHYQPVRGEAPSRARTGHNPLHRKEYLLHVRRN
ncbi:MAG: GTP-binding protein [Mycobacteriales bacterium]